LTQFQISINMELVLVVTLALHLRLVTISPSTRDIVPFIKMIVPKGTHVRKLIASNYEKQVVILDRRGAVSFDGKQAYRPLAVEWHPYSAMLMHQKPKQRKSRASLRYNSINDSAGSDRGASAPAAVKASTKRRYNYMVAN